MLRRSLLLVLLLAACSNGAQADLPYIGQARSLGAEWALVNEQAAKGQLNSTYVDTMRTALREQLQTAATSLTNPHSRYGEEIETLLREPDDASPEELRAHSNKLKKIEASLESA